MNRMLAGLLLLCVLALPGLAYAADAGNGVQKTEIRHIVKQVLRQYIGTLNDKRIDPTAKAALKAVVRDNDSFVRHHKAAYFLPFVSGQHPRATVVIGTDSRVQIHALDYSPDNKLYVVRDLGNQIVTAEGSVAYGVRHLHTPLLLIVGHPDSWAIREAAGNHSNQPPDIRRELDTIQIPRGDSGLAGVELNVNNQIRYAMNKFENEFLDGKLTIVGAIYDFSNALGRGRGKLTVINVNGETDPARIATLNLMRGLEAHASRKRRTRHK